MISVQELHHRAVGIHEKKFDTLWSDFFVDNPASGRVMEKCGFRDTGEINYCSKLQVGNDRPVKVMKLRKERNQT